MRIKDRVIKGLNVEQIIIPRGDDEPIVFIAQAVMDYDKFDVLVPFPKRKQGRNRSGQLVDVKNDATYDAMFAEYQEKRFAYMLLTSLAATPDLHWDTIDLNDPNTWINYKSELKDAGITDPEFGRIVRGVSIACGLDEAKVEAARQRFLAGQQAGESDELSFPRDEQSSTQSGEPASVSE